MNMHNPFQQQILTNSLKLFNDAIVAKHTPGQGENVEASSYEGDINEQKSNQDHLESNYIKLFK